jgi:glycosyltransferase involved in cell wall biosynthesis
VGSVNFQKDFYMKGGHEIIRAYHKLTKTYGDISLTIRANLPKEIAAKCAEIPNLHILSERLDAVQLEAEFLKADIFAFPAHNTPGRVFLDAMSYELPIVTTDVWANSEMVIDGENGILIEPSKRIEYVDENNLPLWGSEWYEENIRDPDPVVEQDLAKALETLIRDPGLRRRMGKKGRSMVENGRFSIQSRNKILGQVFDRALI